jgi:hypothetical protein
MWVDPGEVIVRTTWSYCPGGTEEVLYSTKTQLASPNVEPSNSDYYPTRGTENKKAQELLRAMYRIGDGCGVIASA